jgi:predicted amidohydrolase
MQQLSDKAATVAAIQMVSAPDTKTNLANAGRLIAQAADAGAGMVLLPEYWPIMGQLDTDKIAVAEPFGSGPIQAQMAAWAEQHQIWLIGGTLPLRSPSADHVFNTTLVYAPDGSCRQRYDKIHLFSFHAGEEAYDEARTIAPGDSVTTFDAPFGKVGLSVCYDLRFPELYRAMGQCTLIVVPAAFTYTTGVAHWELLLRARAVENQCYVLAAGQGGLHPTGRRTFGHSMLIDPWGKVLSVLDEGEGVVSGTLQPDIMAGVRTRLPALAHRKL